MNALQKAYKEISVPRITPLEAGQLGGYHGDKISKMSIKEPLAVIILDTNHAYTYSALLSTLSLNT